MLILCVLIITFRFQIEICLNLKVLFQIFFKNHLYYLFNLNKIFIKLSRLVCQQKSGFRTLKSSTIAEILAI